MLGGSKGRVMQSVGEGSLKKSWCSWHSSGSLTKWKEISSILIPEEIFQIPASVGLSIDRTQMIIVDNVDGCFVTMLNKHEALTLADNLMKLAMEMTS